MKHIYHLLLTLLCLLLTNHACAQIEVQLQPVRKDFVAGENVALKITITNQTDATLHLANTPGRPWLNVTLTKRGEQGLLSPIAQVRYPEVTLTPGSTRSFEFSLKTMYRLTTAGNYTAIATIRMPDGKSTYGSNRAMFTLTTGGKIRDFNIQARGQRINLSLRLANIGGKPCLFGQATNLDTNQIIGSCFLAEYLNFMRPSVLLDSAFNMHVLCQSTPDFYTYSVMDTHGRRSSAKLYKRVGTTVDLISTGKGILTVGVIPYVAPPPGKENVRKASERPF